MRLSTLLPYDTSLRSDLNHALLFFTRGLWYKLAMTMEEYRASLTGSEPPPGLDMPLAALWWDAQGEWERAHQLVDALTSADGMAVHAYLHRKEGVDWNAEYWYARAGTQFRRTELSEEWEALVNFFLRASTPS